MRPTISSYLKQHKQGVQSCSQFPKLHSQGPARLPVNNSLLANNGGHITSVLSASLLPGLTFVAAACPCAPDVATLGHQNSRTPQPAPATGPAAALPGRVITASKALPCAHRRRFKHAGAALLEPCYLTCCVSKSQLPVKKSGSCPSTHAKPLCSQPGYE